MYDFFSELAEFFNSFMKMLIGNEHIYSKVWQDVRMSQIYKMLMSYRENFPQPISWAIFVVIFTTLLEFKRRGRMF